MKNCTALKKFFAVPVGAAVRFAIVGLLQIA
jgi:hypothetical protein